jgi:hypothetical protein
MKHLNSIPKKLLAAMPPALLCFILLAPSAAMAQAPTPAGGGGGGGGLIPRSKIHPNTSPGFFNYIWAGIGLVAAIYGALSIFSMLSGAKKGIDSIDSDVGMNSRAFTKAGASAAFSALCLGGGIFLIANQGLSAIGIS